MLVVFDDPVTEGQALPVEDEPAAAARAIGSTSTTEGVLQRVVRLPRSVQLDGAQGHPQPHGRRPHGRGDAGHISVVGGTGDFFMAARRRNAPHHAVERIVLLSASRMDIKRYECYV
ncbi:hypothetical protein D1007_21757 [Hordeum vulgare]|nr:hypothetical protein D1007_21757 [Hordeum vulgare]